MNSRTIGVLAAIAALAAASVAMADSEREPAEPTSPEPPRPSAAADGAFLPFTQTASSRPTSGMIHSGYDGARKILVYQAFADAHVIDRLSVRAGYVSNDLSGQ